MICLFSLISRSSIGSPNSRRGVAANCPGEDSDLSQEVENMGHAVGTTSNSESWALLEE